MVSGFPGFLGVDALFYNAAVEQMDGSVGVAGIAGIVGNHAKGCAAAMKFSHEFHHSLAIS